MIDLHCHILPAMDDGAEDMDEAVALCRSAVENGISAVAATPHFCDYYDMEGFVALRERRAEELRAAAAGLNLELKIETGAELFLCDDIFDVGNLTPLSLSGSRYMLCEYSLAPFDPHYASVCAEYILSSGFIPIIAHPERHITFYQNRWVVEELSQMGALFQVNTASLAGKGGEQMKDFATELVLDGRADFIATDAHAPVLRPNDYLNCRRNFDGRISEEMLLRLTQTNPLLVLSDGSV